MTVDRTVDAVVFVWDGTVVSDRPAGMAAVRRRVEALCAAGVDVAVLSVSSLRDVDGRLRARPSGPGRLLLYLGRGSETFEVLPEGPRLLRRIEASTAERNALHKEMRFALEAANARNAQLQASL